MQKKRSYLQDLQAQMEQDRAAGAAAAAAAASAAAAAAESALTSEEAKAQRLDKIKERKLQQLRRVGSFEWHS